MYALLHTRIRVWRIECASFFLLLSVEFHTIFPRILLHCVVSISNYKIIIISVVNTKNNNLEASFKSNAAVETIIFSKFIYHAISFFTESLSTMSCFACQLHVLDEVKFEIILVIVRISPNRLFLCIKTVVDWLNWVKYYLL